MTIVETFERYGANRVLLNNGEKSEAHVVVRSYAGAKFTGFSLKKQRILEGSRGGRQDSGKAKAAFGAWRLAPRGFWCKRTRQLDGSVPLNSPMYKISRVSSTEINQPRAIHTLTG